MTKKKSYPKETRTGNTSSIKTLWGRLKNYVNMLISYLIRIYIPNMIPLSGPYGRLSTKNKKRIADKFTKKSGVLCALCSL